MSLWVELKRRNVVKVGIAYLALAWVAIQATSLIVPALNLPAVLNTIVVYIGIVVFPFALIISWAFELTPEGVKRSRDVLPETSIASQTGRNIEHGIVVLLLIALSLMFWDSYLKSPSVKTPSQQVTAAPIAEGVEELEHSIAVLPFVNMSDDKDYFADGLSEELLNLLAKIPTLRVAARTSSFAFKGQNQNISKIAEALNVTTLLEGSVRRSGSRIRITAQLINAADGFHLWSQTYDRELSDIFAVQDEIAAAIIAAMKIHLNVAPPSRGLPTTNMEAYALYLEVLSQESVGDVHWMMKEIDKVLELAPNFAEAHLFIAGVMWGYGVLNERRELTLQRAQYHLDKALAISPKLADARYLSDLMAFGDEWVSIEAEDRFRIMFAKYPESSDLVEIYGWFLLRAGYFTEALRVSAKGIRKDPQGVQFYGIQALALEGLDRMPEAMERWGFFIARTQAYYLVNIFALEALIVGDEAYANQLMAEFAANTGEDAASVRLFLDRLLEPSTRHAAYDSPESLRFLGPDQVESVRPRLFFQLQDEQFWPEFPGLLERGRGLQLLHTLLPLNSPRFINHRYMREHMEDLGMLEFWQQYGLPDFCDGSFESWVCELPVDAATKKELSY